MAIESWTALYNKPLKFMGDEQFLSLWFVEHSKIGAAGLSQAAFFKLFLSCLTVSTQNMNKS